MIDHILTDIAQRFNLRHRNGRFTGQCPKCGGSPTTDRFQMRDDGGFKCWSCDFKGRLEKFLREIDGLKCPDAYEATGQQCDFAACPVRGTCRLGDGSGRRSRSTPRSVAPQAQNSRRGLSVAEPGTPHDAWRTWAEELVERGVHALRKNTDWLSWLAARGIDSEAVQRFRLGWQERSIYPDRATIGLTPERDGKTTLWIPYGLIVPVWHADDTLHRLRIRRTDQARSSFLPKLKYVWIEGSGSAPHVIIPAGPSRGVVIIEAELDAYACAAAHPEVTVIAIGTVNAALSLHVLDLLAAAPVILVALDADPDKAGQPGAGPKTVQIWLDTYRQAKYWPVPAGKDPGDYVRDHRGDLRAWIEAGLPVQARQDQVFTCEVPAGGGGGEEYLPKPCPVRVIEGREVYFPSNPEDWHRLVAEKKIVIGPKEAHLMIERSDLLPSAGLLAEVKEIFPGCVLSKLEVI